MRQYQATFCTRGGSRVIATIKGENIEQALERSKKMAIIISNRTGIRMYLAFVGLIRNPKNF